MDVDTITPGCWWSWTPVAGRRWSVVRGTLVAWTAGRGVVRAGPASPGTKTRPAIAARRASRPRPAVMSVVFIVSLLSQKMVSGLTGTPLAAPWGGGAATNRKAAAFFGAGGGQAVDMAGQRVVA